MSPRALTMSEDDLLEAVVDTATILGWHVYHPLPARTAKGVRTAQMGHTGYPDLTLAHHRHGVLFRELKSQAGIVAPDQLEWLNKLTNGGADAGVWRPLDWTQGRIEARLRGLTITPLGQL